MKKFILMAVSITLILSLAACTGKTDNPKKTNPTSDSLQSKNQETSSTKRYLGQISKKVGNDIALSLGKFVVDNNGGSGEGVMIDKDGNQSPVEGNVGDDAGGDMIMIPVPDDGDEKGDSKGSGDSAIEKLPIEFSGEVIEFTIPAGAKIINTAGKEIAFDSITKGKLIQLTVNETSGVVERVMVW